jgi:hypothetical protein
MSDISAPLERSVNETFCVQQEGQMVCCHFNLTSSDGSFRTILVLLIAEKQQGTEKLSRSPTLRMCKLSITVGYIHIAVATELIQMCWSS